MNLFINSIFILFSICLVVALVLAICDQMMERFLKGDMATQRDLENAVWASQSSSEASSK